MKVGSPPPTFALLALGTFQLWQPGSVAPLSSGALEKLRTDDIPGSSIVAPRVGTVGNCGGQTYCHREQDLQPDFGVTWKLIFPGRRLLKGGGRGWGVEVEGLGVAQVQDGSGSPRIRPECGVSWGPGTPKTDCSIGSHQRASGPETQEF